MAIVPREKETYSRLAGMVTPQPEATPTKRVGTETPVGAVTSGPSAGKGPSEFTQTTTSSPGSIFGRQLGGADISGITKLAEQPLLREAGAESSRVAGEGLQYKKTQEENLAKQPSFKDYSSALSDIAGGKEDTTGKAQTILQRTDIPVPKLDIPDIKEFTPQQALRGGSVDTLLRKEATGPYTTGMAGLDALLFAKKGGAAQLAERGTALRTTEQAAADALEKSATEEAQKKAKDFVESQRTGLIDALTGELTGRRAGFESGLESVRSGRAAAQNQAYQDALQNYLTQSGAIQASLMSELYPPSYQTTSGAPAEAVDIGGVIQTGPGAPVPMAPPELQVRDPEAMRAAMQGVDINALLGKYITPGSINQPTLADVAALSPDKAKEYTNLMNLLKLGPGQDVSKFGLGQVTTPGTPTTSASPQDIEAAIRQALKTAALGAPLKTIKTGTPTYGGVK